MLVVAYTLEEAYNFLYPLVAYKLVVEYSFLLEVYNFLLEVYNFLLEVYNFLLEVYSYQYP
jgi:hypothetical protein